MSLNNDNKEVQLTLNHCLFTPFGYKTQTRLDKWYTYKTYTSTTQCKYCVQRRDAGLMTTM